MTITTTFLFHGERITYTYDSLEACLEFCAGITADGIVEDLKAIDDSGNQVWPNDPQP